MRHDYIRDVKQSYHTYRFCNSAVFKYTIKYIEYFRIVKVHDYKDELKLLLSASIGAKQSSFNSLNYIPLNLNINRNDVSTLDSRNVIVLD